MHRTVRRIIRALDGAPRGRKGQSLIELSVSIPFLALMIFSLAEVGFVANNYLLLLDLVRESGRRGANLNPTTWDESQTRNYERLDCDFSGGIYNINPEDTYLKANPRKLRRGPDATAYGYGVTYGTDGNPVDFLQFGYYDSIICQAATTMAPMEFEDAIWGSDGTTESQRNRDLFSRNDIVVSAFSYVRLDYDLLTPASSFVDGSIPIEANKVWITVTGRYPLTNRFCRNAAGDGDRRDPFDFMRQDFFTDWHNGATNPDTYDPDGPGGPISPWVEMQGGAAPYALTDTSQGIRGFVFTGLAVTAADQCLGSRFTVQDVEMRLNQRHASISSAVTDELLVRIPNGGMVIVEIFWQHHPIFLGPIFQGFTGDPADDPVLYVYGIFPSAGAAPTATP